MAFDITPYVDKTPAEVRALCRDGVIDFPTAGMCRGYAQANLVILPPEYAADFEEFAKKNPFPCPILEIIKGTPDTHAMGEGGNICTDIPRYRIYENGVFTKELTDVSSYWKEGYVGFLIGCSKKESKSVTFPRDVTYQCLRRISKPFLLDHFPVLWYAPCAR